MKSDIEIANSIEMKPITEIAKKLKVPYTIMKPSYADENYHLIEVNN